MLYVVIAVMIGLLGVAGFLRFVVLRSRAARRDANGPGERSRRPAVDHFAPTVGTSSEKKRKGKKSKRDSLAFHPVAPEEHEANRKRAGLGGETRVKRQRDRKQDISSPAWTQSAGSETTSSFDSSSTSDGSSSSPSSDSSTNYSSSYDSSSDYGSGSSDSSWSSSSDSYSDSSSGGDFGGGGSTDSY